MTKDIWTPRLSEYLDGELSPDQRAGCQAHLADCADCRTTLDELRHVVARARMLEGRPPAGDLWPAIAALLGSEVAPLEPRLPRKARRFSLTLPQLAAAGIALMLLSAGTAWVARSNWGSPVASGSAPATTPVSLAASGAASQKYDAAVNDLQKVLELGRGRLDTATVRVLEQNLALIDRAIGEAQRAVAADPRNVYLNGHLSQTRMRKLELLRRAASLVSAAS
ncbi:MAG: anti-sigma factor family protein [Gemmatimonadales bacterium]